ncbi:hypothetical protein Metme_2984 [Methylomonas methanica MC09]|uniref:Uncharacterized protein n=1 Tax=Methylomonas methanica (strain DSM 25384 / MC09) TaxID=857087 RepID=G0A1Y0_METMM|nr:hypothetical protein Metme_2984 [Methylomonas methanica MC09]
MYFEKKYNKNINKDGKKLRSLSLTSFFAACYIGRYKLFQTM